MLPSVTAEVSEPNGGGSTEENSNGQPPEPASDEATDPWQRAIDRGWGAAWAEHPWSAPQWRDDGDGRGWTDWSEAGRDWYSGNWSQGSWDSRHSWPADGILNRRQLQDFHTANVPRMGSFGDHGTVLGGDLSSRRHSAALPNI